MYMQSGRNRYATDAVATATPAKLLTMLYDRLVLDLAQAEQAQRNGDRHGANDLLQHAQNIVIELHSTLRIDAWAGAPQLAAIYSFLLAEMVAANVTMDAKRTASCRAVVEPLRQAWHEAAAALPSAAPPGRIAASA